MREDSWSFVPANNGAAPCDPVRKLGPVAFEPSPLHVQSMTQLMVWFDGGCPLCRREIALMRRLDHKGAIDFIDVNANPSVCPIDQTLLLKRFHALEDGRLVSGATAFAAMWRAIPRLRPLGLMARNPAVLGGLERIYIAFLRFRPILQRFAARFDRLAAPE